MVKYLAASAVAVGALLFAVHASSAADGKKYTFALVLQSTDTPIADILVNGCKKAEADLGGAIECLHVGPSTHGGGDEEVQVVADLIAKHVDGIALSAANAAAMAHGLAGAKAAGIPVVTYDSDLLPQNKDMRLAYIGTNNYDMGVQLAKLLQTKKPKGGTLCIESGGAAATNLNYRIQGIRDTLSGTKSAEFPGIRLTGQNGWTEVSGCPTYVNDDLALAVQTLEDIMAKYPDLDALVPDGGWPEFLPSAYEKFAVKYKDKIQSGKLALIVADTLPVQIDLLKSGLASGNVGQRFFEMAYKSMVFLKDFKDGKGNPPDPYFTGFDVCTSENFATCVAK